MTDQEIRELEVLERAMVFYATHDHPAYGDGCGDYREYDEEVREVRERYLYLSRKKTRLSESRRGTSGSPRLFIFRRIVLEEGYGEVLYYNRDTICELTPPFGPCLGVCPS